MVDGRLFKTKEGRIWRAAEEVVATLREEAEAIGEFGDGCREDEPDLAKLADEAKASMTRLADAIVDAIPPEWWKNNTPDVEAHERPNER
jgi:hypothetical protein